MKEESNTELPSRGTGVESSADGLLHGPETNDNMVNNDGVSVDLSTSRRPSVQKVQARSEAVDFTTSLNEKDNFYETRPLSRKKSHHRTEKVESARKHSTKGKSTLLTDAKPQNSRMSVDTVEVSASNHPFSVEHEGENNAHGHGKTTSEPSSAPSAAKLSSSTILLPSKAKVSQASSSSGLKTSMQKVVQHFRPPKSSKPSQPSTSVNEVTRKI